MWNSCWTKVPHRAPHGTIAKDLVPLDVDFSNLYFGTLLHAKGDLERRRRDLLDLRIDSRVLTAALRKELFEDVRCALNLTGIVLRLHGEADAPLFEAVQNLGNG